MGDMADYINDETPPQNCLECQYWNPEDEECELNVCHYGYGSTDLQITGGLEDEY